VLLTRALAEQSISVSIDRNARKGQKPSDHAPVVVEVSGLV
jgi:exonuclease III